MGEEGCIREKSMNEDQEKRRIKGCKINLYPLKTLLPFPHPCTLLLTNKRGLYTNQRPPAASAGQPVGFLEEEQHMKMSTDVWFYSQPKFYWTRPEYRRPPFTEGNHTKQ